MSLLLAQILDYLPMLPLLIFAAELCVVTLGTIRIIFVSRGMKAIAALLGFFEVCTWLFAIGQIMQNLTDLGCYLGFAAGFTFGNYLGICIEKRLAIGTLILQTITHRNATDLVERLRLARYGVTSIDAKGATGPVKIVFSVIKRKDLPAAVALVRAFDPQAFYAVNEVREATGTWTSGTLRSGQKLRRLLRAAWTSPPAMAPRLSLVKCDEPAKNAA